MRIFAQSNLSFSDIARMLQIPPNVVNKWNIRKSVPDSYIGKLREIAEQQGIDCIAPDDESHADIKAEIASLKQAHAERIAQLDRAIEELTNKLNLLES